MNYTCSDSDLSLDSEFRLILPACLENSRYVVIGSAEDPELSEILELLTWIAPDSRCEGVSPDIRAGILNIVISPELGASIACGNAVIPASTPVAFLPIPQRYPWAYWDVWQCYRDAPELRNNLMSFDAFRHMFSRCRYVSELTKAESLRDWNDAESLFCYWGSDRSHFGEHSDAFARIASSLVDEQSRLALQLALESKPQALWETFIGSVFRQADYRAGADIRTGDCVLNLGVFSGHEIPYFCTRMGAGGRLFNFDPLGHDLLSPRSRKYSSAAGDMIQEVRFAAGATNGLGQFGFYHDGQAFKPSSGTQAKTIEFDIVPIDAFVAQHELASVDFIKMDIEGMEPEALSGMRETIDRFRPTLAVSIYHSPEQMWSIPLQLMQELNNYVFRIDHYSPFRWETVLTAIPKEKWEA